MEIQRILVAGNYEEDFKQYVNGEGSVSYRYIPVDEISRQDLIWADAYVGFEPCSTFDVSALKWVHSFNAGVNNFLEVEGWEEHNVLLTRTVCSFGQRISEYCLSYVLRELQYQAFFADNQRTKTWVKKTPKMVKDQTFVIFGTGEIGQEVAKTFHQFGAKVYGVSNSGNQKAYFQKVTTPSSAEKFLQEADWVISTLPLTKDTHHLFNEQLFRHFTGAAFINIGRGATVDEAALIQALDQQAVRLAVLDVFTTEPLPEDSLFWEREDVVMTPHISAVTELDEAIGCFLETLDRIQQDKPLTNKVEFNRGY